jgi:predicted permease
MGNSMDVLLAVLPPFVLMFVGGLGRKFNCIPVEAEASLSRFIIRILYPCFIIHQVLGASEPVTMKEAWIAPVFGFLSISIGFGISHLIGQICGFEKRENRAFRFCCGIFNYGFFALPIASIVFGDFLIVKIILFNLGVEIAIWSVGVLLLTSSGISLTKLLNPPALSVLFALVIQALGGRELIPQPLWTVLSMISACSIPFALMVIGSSFAGLLRNFRPSVGYRVEMGAICARNIAVPACFMLYAKWGWFPSGMDWMAFVLVVQAAMPAGVFALLVVKNYSESSEVGMRSILATMVGCIITLPAWIYAGKNWVLN